MAKKKNTLKYVLIGAGVLVLGAVAGNKLGWFGSGDTVQVATDKVQKKAVIETVSASGKVQPEVEVKLSSEVSGEIIEVLVREGDPVKKGQLLCRVRPDILKSGYDRAVASLNSQRANLAASQQQLKQAQANFENIEARFKRNQELYNQKVISAAEFENVRAEYNAARANLEAVRQNVVGSGFGVQQSAAIVKEAGDNLAKTAIYAPVDGIVSKLSVEPGERVVGTAQMAGTEILRISNLNAMEVSVDVNESDINRVSIGDTALIEVDAFQGKKFQGTVSEIASSANVVGASADQVTNFTVKIRILPESYAHLMQPGSSNRYPFRPGLSATVDIQTEKVMGWVVPIQSVTTREEKKNKKSEENEEEVGQDEENDRRSNQPVKEYVFVYENGKVKQVQVTTGIQDDTNIIVLSGLKGTEEVVSRPFTAISKTLKDEMQVEKVAKSKLSSKEK